MFKAFAAIAVIPENLDEIVTMLGSNADLWKETLPACFNSKTKQYIIFYFTENPYTLKRVHTLMSSSLLEETCHMAVYTKTIMWITKKK